MTLVLDNRAGRSADRRPAPAAVGLGAAAEALVPRGQARPADRQPAVRRRRRPAHPEGLRLAAVGRRGPRGEAHAGVREGRAAQLLPRHLLREEAEARADHRRPVERRPGRSAPKSQAEILKDVGEGILVTGFIGGNSNGTTGDYSLGVQGFRIRGGAARRAGRGDEHRRQHARPAEEARGGRQRPVAVLVPAHADARVRGRAVRGALTAGDGLRPRRSRGIRDSGGSLWLVRCVDPVKRLRNRSRPFPRAPGAVDRGAASVHAWPRNEPRHGRAAGRGTARASRRPGSRRPPAPTS